MGESRWWEKRGGGSLWRKLDPGIHRGGWSVEDITGFWRRTRSWENVNEGRSLFPLRLMTWESSGS
jgi:hypothetical protein